jgi:hypothetical protein
MPAFTFTIAGWLMWGRRQKSRTRDFYLPEAPVKDQYELNDTIPLAVNFTANDWQGQLLLEEEDERDHLPDDTGLCA